MPNPSPVRVRHVPGGTPFAPEVPVLLRAQGGKVQIALNDAATRVKIRSFDDLTGGIEIETDNINSDLLQELNILKNADKIHDVSGDWHWICPVATPDQLGHEPNRCSSEPNNRWNLRITVQHDAHGNEVSALIGNEDRLALRHPPGPDNDGPAARAHGPAYHVPDGENRAFILDHGADPCNDATWNPPPSRPAVVELSGINLINPNPMGNRKAVLLQTRGDLSRDPATWQLTTPPLLSDIGSDVQNFARDYGLLMEGNADIRRPDTWIKHPADIRVNIAADGTFPEYDGTKCYGTSADGRPFLLVQEGTTWKPIELARNQAHRRMNDIQIVRNPNEPPFGKFINPLDGSEGIPADVHLQVADNGILAESHVEKCYGTSTNGRSFLFVRDGDAWNPIELAQDLTQHRMNDVKIVRNPNEPPFGEFINPDTGNENNPPNIRLRVTGDRALTDCWGTNCYGVANERQYLFAKHGDAWRQIEIAQDQDHNAFPNMQVVRTTDDQVLFGRGIDPYTGNPRTTRELHMPLPCGYRLNTDGQLVSPYGIYLSENHTEVADDCREFGIILNENGEPQHQTPHAKLLNPDHSPQHNDNIFIVLNRRDPDSLFRFHPNNDDPLFVYHTNQETLQTSTSYVFRLNTDGYVDTTHAVPFDNRDREPNLEYGLLCNPNGVTPAPYPPQASQIRLILDGHGEPAHRDGCYWGESHDGTIQIPLTDGLKPRARRGLLVDTNANRHFREGNHYIGCVLDEDYSAISPGTNLFACSADGTPSDPPRFYSREKFPGEISVIKENYPTTFGKPLDPHEKPLFIINGPEVNLYRGGSTENCCAVAVGYTDADLRLFRASPERVARAKHDLMKRRHGIFRDKRFVFDGVKPETSLPPQPQETDIYWRTCPGTPIAFAGATNEIVLKGDREFEGYLARNPDAPILIASTAPPHEIDAALASKISRSGIMAKAREALETNKRYDYDNRTNRFLKHAPRTLIDQVKTCELSTALAAKEIPLLVQTPDGRITKGSLDPTRHRNDVILASAIGYSTKPNKTLTDLFDKEDFNGPQWDKIKKSAKKFNDRSQRIVYSPGSHQLPHGLKHLDGIDVALLALAAPPAIATAGAAVGVGLGAGALWGLGAGVHKAGKAIIRASSSPKDATTQNTKDAPASQEASQQDSTKQSAMPQLTIKELVRINAEVKIDGIAYKNLREALFASVLPDEKNRYLNANHKSKKAFERLILTQLKLPPEQRHWRVQKWDYNKNLVSILTQQALQNKHVYEKFEQGSIADKLLLSNVTKKLKKYPKPEFQPENFEIEASNPENQGLKFQNFSDERYTDHSSRRNRPEVQHDPAQGENPSMPTSLPLRPSTRLPTSSTRAR